MSAPAPSRADDIRLLTLLDRIDNDDLTFKAAGSISGQSKAAVSGAVRRVRIDLESAGECLCSKPENKDGGLPRRWWK